MSLEVETILVPATGCPARRAADELDETLHIAVVFTSEQSTVAALKEARHLAVSLGARVTLVVPQVVPYPLPLETPPVFTAFNEKRFRAMAGENQRESRVQIYLCRDRLQTLCSVLKPGHILVVGGRKRWWPTKDKTLVRRLQRAGYEVVFKETT